MSVIYRPHRGGLDEAMASAKEFDSFEDLQNYIVKDMEQFIKLNPCEVVAEGYPHEDDRIGWKDSDYLCIDSYMNVEDKDGYVKYFGEVYNHPLCIGMFAINYNK